MTTEKTQAKGQTTRDFVEIADIKTDGESGVLVLKNGSLRSVIEVNSMNFELKSSDEQTAIIQSFQNFLNSVDFPLQIAISSRKLDIQQYLKFIDGIIETQQNELLKIQAIEYSRLLKGLTELSNIMAKKFYAIVPFHGVESAPTKAGFFDAVTGLLTPAKFAKPLSDENFENYKVQLNQRVELVRNGINGLGLETKILSKDQLFNLLYSYYNPWHSLQTSTQI